MSTSGCEGQGNRLETVKTYEYSWLILWLISQVTLAGRNKHIEVSVTHGSDGIGFGKKALDLRSRYLCHEGSETHFPKGMTFS